VLHGHTYMWQVAPLQLLGYSLALCGFVGYQAARQWQQAVPYEPVPRRSTDGKGAEVATKARIPDALYSSASFAATDKAAPAAATAAGGATSLEMLKLQHRGSLLAGTDGGELIGTKCEASDLHEPAGYDVGVSPRASHEPSMLRISPPAMLSKAASTSSFLGTTHRRLQ
jgi:hypothetical protein